MINDRAVTLPWDAHDRFSVTVDILRAHASPELIRSFNSLASALKTLNLSHQMLKKTFKIFTKFKLVLILSTWAPVLTRCAVTT